MSRASVLHTLFIALMLVAFLRPHADAQQTGPSMERENAVSDASTSAPDAKAPAEFLKPAAPNPFERPQSSTHRRTDDSDSGDSLVLRLDRKWTSASAQYVFAAPPGFYSASRNEPGGNDWDSLLSSGITAYLNPSNTTAVRMTSDLEFFGQKREAGAAGQPGGHAFTMEWQVAHLLPSRLGPVEVAAGAYRQQLVSYPAFPNGPLTDVLLGYSASTVGFETRVTLPDRNLTFSFRYGTEHVQPGRDKSHVALFELAWTW
ncbi:MAG TPA: hypothetical protein VL240_13750 [Candidatus Binatia bacterium]|nr:hypothetical protein [Candidatus Binatia bacterium]